MERSGHEYDGVPVSSVPSSGRFYLNMKVQLLGKAVMKCEITSESHGKCVYAMSTWQCDATHPCLIDRAASIFEAMARAQAVSH